MFNGTLATQLQAGDDYFFLFGHPTSKNTNTKSSFWISIVTSAQVNKLRNAFLAECFLFVFYLHQNIFVK